MTEETRRRLQPSCTPICCAGGIFPLSLRRKTRTESKTMNSRLKAIGLIVLCLLVQVIAVCPHHHHADALCLRLNTHPVLPVKVPQPCGAGCITHFSLTMPGEAASPLCRRDTPRHKNGPQAEQATRCLRSGHHGDSSPKTQPMPPYAIPPAGCAGLRSPPQIPSDTLRA